MKKRILIIGMALTLFCCWTLPAAALEPIPKEDGFSGFIRMGGGVLSYSGNMVAGNGMLDVSDETITSLTDSADSETTGVPAFDFEAAYTFARSRTQLFLGSTMEDVARLEAAQQLAVKQELPDKSLVSAGFLFSGIPTEVWQDPYLTGSPRQETDRDSKGAKLAFDRILGTGLQIIYTFRDIDIDEENSGASLGLSLADQDLLVRDGKNHGIEFLYRFNLGQGSFVEPGVKLFDEDRDGDAMSNDGYEVRLTYLYLGNPLSVVLTGSVGKADFDAENPIYNQTREDDLYLFGAQVYYANPFGWKPFGHENFSVYGSFAYYYEDSDINFYDTEVIMADVGVMFRF